MVMSEAAAEKYFGGADPIGKVVTLQKDIALLTPAWNQERKAKVAEMQARLDQITRTSSIKFDFLVSLETVRAFSDDLDEWSVHRMATFLLVPEKFDRPRFEGRFPAFLSKHFEESPESPQRMYLFPFLDFPA